MWKRYETLTKDQQENSEEISSAPVLGDATNTAHSVKRLRLKGAPENLAGGKENKATEYLATLQDDAKGTPRSNCTPSYHDINF